MTADAVYCASDVAILAATRAWWETAFEPPPSEPLADALIAAHAADLGIDRSVCLRDVLDWLTDQPTTLSSDAFAEAANALLRAFGTP